MEIDFEQIRGRPLSLALRGWVASVGLAFAAVGLLHVIPGVHAPLMVTVALTTTGLGALLPLLRDGGHLEAPFSRLLLAAGFNPRTCLVARQSLSHPTFPGGAWE